MRYTWVLRCSDHISTIKRLLHLWYLMYSSSCGKTGGGVLSFGRIVGYNRVLCIESQKSILIGFQKHDIITPMSQNPRLEDPRTIKKFIDTLHTIFVKPDIYQKVHYLHNQSIYPLPTHLTQAFE